MCYPIHITTNIKRKEAMKKLCYSSQVSWHLQHIDIVSPYGPRMKPTICYILQKTWKQRIDRLANLEYQLKPIHTNMKESKRHRAFSLIFLLLTLWSSTSKEIEVPALKDSTPVSVKLGLSKIIKQPDFEFEKVYKREVNKIYSEDTSGFPPCHENKPEVEFDVLDEIVFQGIPKRPLLLQKFQDIEYSQFLLDVYYQDLKIYIMFKNGRVALITLQNDDKIASKDVFDTKDLPANTLLDIGYFIKVEKNLLFVNEAYTILVTDKSATVVPGYGKHQQFESVHAMESGTYGVLDTTAGVTVYYFDGKAVKRVETIAAEILFPGSAGRPDLKDLIYWPEKKTLLVLDRFLGVYSYQIEYSTSPNNMSQVPALVVQSNRPPKITNQSAGAATTFKPPASQPQNIRVNVSQIVSRHFGCKLMYKYNNMLYVYCEVMNVFNIERFPSVVQTYMPYPNIEVKEIYQVDDLVAFVGNNVFSVVYLGRLVNYYQDGNLDKLLLFKDLFISANEEGIDIGNIVIVKPYITCFTDNDYFLGRHQLQFKTYAECNEQYFKKYQVNKAQLGEIEEDDVCVYTVYKELEYWKVGEVKTFPFLIALAVILGLALIAVVIFLVKKVKIRRVMQMIEEYSSLNPQSDSAKPHELQEEMDGGVEMETNSQKAEREAKESKDPKKAKEADENDTKKPSEVELAEGGHSIE